MEEKIVTIKIDGNEVEIVSNNPYNNAPIHCPIKKCGKEMKNHHVGYVTEFNPYLRIFCRICPAHPLKGHVVAKPI